MKSRLALQVIAAVAVAALPLAASAAVPGQEQLKGTVTAFNGKYSLHVEDTKSKDIDAVQLHQGTIINPTGLTLRPGMKVTILGTPSAGGVLDANEIDTPYHVAYDQNLGYGRYGGYGGFGSGYGFGPGFGYDGFYGGGPFFGGPLFGAGFGW